MGFAAGASAGAAAYNRPRELAETRRSNMATEAYRQGDLGIRRKQLKLEQAKLDLAEEQAKIAAAADEADIARQTARDESTAAYQRESLGIQRRGQDIQARGQDLALLKEAPALKKAQLELAQYEKNQALDALQEKYLSSLGASPEEQARMFAMLKAGRVVGRFALQQLMGGNFTGAEKFFSIYAGGIPVKISQAQDGTIAVRGGVPGQPMQYYQEFDSKEDMGSSIANWTANAFAARGQFGWGGGGVGIKTSGSKTTGGGKATSGEMLAGSVGITGTSELDQKGYRAVQVALKEYTSIDPVTGEPRPVDPETVSLASKYLEEGVPARIAYQMAVDMSSDPNAAIIKARSGGYGKHGKRVTGAPPARKQVGIPFGGRKKTAPEYYAGKDVKLEEPARDKKGNIVEPPSSGLKGFLQKTKEEEVSLPPLTEGQLKAWRKDPAIQKWRQEFREKFGYSPDPQDPRGQYNYGKAISAGCRPMRDPETGELHWPDKTPDGEWLKMPGHPTRSREMGGEEGLRRMGVQGSSYGIGKEAKATRRTDKDLKALERAMRLGDEIESGRRKKQALPAGLQENVETQEEKLMRGLAGISKTPLGREGRAFAMLIVNSLNYLMDVLVSRPAVALKDSVKAELKSFQEWAKSRYKKNESFEIDENAVREYLQSRGNAPV